MADPHRRYPALSGGGGGSALIGRRARRGTSYRPAVPIASVSLGHIPSAPGISRKYPTNKNVMMRTTLFHTNRPQAVHLPKNVAFPEGVHEVSILRDGARRVIVPANAVWNDFFNSPPAATWPSATNRCPKPVRRADYCVDDKAMPASKKTQAA